jgi:hypothetical protein
MFVCFTFVPSVVNLIYSKETHSFTHLSWTAAQQSVTKFESVIFTNLVTLKDAFWCLSYLSDMRLSS